MIILVWFTMCIYRSLGEQGAKSSWCYNTPECKFVTTVLLYERLYTWFAIKVYFKAFKSKKELIRTREQALRETASLVMIPPKIHKEGPIVQGRSQEYLVGWVPTLIQERQDLFCCKKYYKICKY